MLTQFNFQSIFWQFKNYISVFHFWDQLFKARLTGGRRSIIWGGGAHIHIFVLTDFKTNRFKKNYLYRTRIYEYGPPHEYLNIYLTV